MQSQPLGDSPLLPLSPLLAQPGLRRLLDVVELVTSASTIVELKQEETTVTISPLQGSFAPDATVGAPRRREL